MSAAILKWMSGTDTGQSSKAIALAALGGDPADGSRRYPLDGADFGRCHRLLQGAPEASIGLQALAKAGGPYWKALSAAWPQLEQAYEADLKDRGERCYALMRTLLEPIENADPNIVRLGSGMTMRWDR